jgi:membrane protease YdiL (CAAX protease family)
LAAFGLTILFLYWDRLRLNDVGAAADRFTPVRLLTGFLMGLVVVTLWASISAATGYVRWERGSEIGFLAPFSALVAYLALSCREELAFHGYPLRRLQRPLGVWGAQLFVAFVFAVEHRLGGYSWPNALFGAGVGSLLFGMAAIATRGLAVPIGLHAAWNFGQAMLGLRGQPGLWKAIVEPGQEERTETATMIVYVVVIASATLAFWLWHRRRNEASRIMSSA